MAGRFIIEQKTIQSLLASMQPICSKRTAVDATACILFQANHKELILKSTDLEISLQSHCPIDQSTFSHTESFLVPGKRVFDLVRELDGTITLSLENNQVALSTNSVHLDLNIKDSQEFPPFPERIENFMQLEACFLLELLDKVGFLIPQNNANPALNGLYLEFNATGLTLTTTDGHCLAQVTTDRYCLDEEKKWLLPRRAVFEVKKLLEQHTDKGMIFLGVCGNQLVFSGDSFNFFSKVLADQFPHYKSILQRDDFLPAMLDRSSFVKTLRRSACLLSGQFLATEFNFVPEKLHVSMENKEVGTLSEELILNKFSGAHLAIRFYAPYLLSGLQAFADEGIHFYLKNESKPIIFEAKKPEYNLTYLVMPVSPATKNA